MSFFEVEKPKSRAKLIGRDYQIEAHDACFRIWDSGVRGALVRSATGTGKTPMACLIADTWMQRGPDYRVMVISYEQQLVWQFAQEIEDFLGMVPGIEMEKECAGPDKRIVVASRASLLRAPPPEPDQLEKLSAYGITEVGAAPARAIKSYLKALSRGTHADSIKEEIEQLNERPEVFGKHWSRLHKFSSEYHWLVIFDEAHRHAYHLTSVGHVADWFDMNPRSKRMGLTATPKRSDEVSIGDKMFPGIALDYPLFSCDKRCAVRDGWAVPYVQKYIEVSGVDFKSIGKIGSDFDPDELERVLGEESKLATLIEPMLDMVGDRRTLIFSPRVAMAKNVALYINARSRCKCPCGELTWHPTLLIGDSAACSCGRKADKEDIDRFPDQARQISEETTVLERREVYRGHQEGKFQFLSVCGLCREGYNDPDIACVAVFRPVSQEASSLAEQMKGRSCRPLRGILTGLETPEERLQAIADSRKPNALIVDLVGITGLADCASTVQIYSEGLPDEVKDLAAELLAEKGKGEEVDVEEVIEEAKRQIAEEKERVKAEREAAEEAAKREFENRAKANADVKYTEHDVGYGAQSDPNEASEKQYAFIEFLGMDLDGLSRRRAGRIIDQLLRRVDPEEVARTNNLNDWQRVGPSGKQLGLMRYKNIPAERAKSKRDAGLLIDAKLDPTKFFTDRKKAITDCRDLEQLSATGKDLALVKGVLPSLVWQQIVQLGIERRDQLNGSSHGIPE
jgi:superfamily II DNA or RNA helicase